MARSQRMAGPTSASLGVTGRGRGLRAAARCGSASRSTLAGAPARGAPADGAGRVPTVGRRGRGTRRGPAHCWPPLCPGTVTLVSGGPGDPGLMTVAGRAAVEQADVLLVDHPSPPAGALAWARSDAVVVDVAKPPRGASTSQERINALPGRARAGRPPRRPAEGRGRLRVRSRDGGGSWPAPRRACRPGCCPASARPSRSRPWPGSRSPTAASSTASASSPARPARAPHLHARPTPPWPAPGTSLVVLMGVRQPAGRHRRAAPARMPAHPRRRHRPRRTPGPGGPRRRPGGPRLRRGRDRPARGHRHRRGRPVRRPHPDRGDPLMPQGQPTRRTRGRAHHHAAPQPAAADGAHRRRQGEVHRRLRPRPAGLEPGLEHRGLPVREVRQVAHRRADRPRAPRRACTTQTGEGGPVEWHKMGSGWSWSRKQGDEPRTTHARPAEGWQEIKRRLAAETHDLLRPRRVHLPDRRGAGWTPTTWPRPCSRRPGRQHVVVTGRRARPAAPGRSPTWSPDMTKVKHPMDAGQKGQKGIEW